MDANGKRGTIAPGQPAGVVSDKIPPEEPGDEGGQSRPKQPGGAGAQGPDREQPGDGQEPEEKRIEGVGRPEFAVQQPVRGAESAAGGAIEPGQALERAAGIETVGGGVQEEDHRQDRRAAKTEQ